METNTNTGARGPLMLILLLLLRPMMDTAALTLMADTAVLSFTDSDTHTDTMPRDLLIIMPALTQGTVITHTDTDTHTDTGARGPLMLILLLLLRPMMDTAALT